jgi:hypothetical protein
LSTARAFLIERHVCFLSDYLLIGYTVFFGREVNALRNLSAGCPPDFSGGG